MINNRYIVFLISIFIALLACLLVFTTDSIDTVEEFQSPLKGHIIESTQTLPLDNFLEQETEQVLVEFTDTDIGYLGLENITKKPVKDPMFMSEFEMKVMDNMVRNLESFIENGKITVQHGDGILPELSISKIIEEWKPEIPENSPSSGVNTEIVKQLRLGDNVTISVGGSISSSSDHLSECFRDKDGNKIDFSYLKEKSPSLCEAASILEDPGNQPRPVLITTRMAGDTIMPLPSWHIVSKEPSKDDMDAWLEWKKNVESQKVWAKKFPFLTEHYEQITLSQERVAKWVADIENRPNTSWMEQEDSYNIDTLFEESVKDKNNFTDWMEEEDSFNLEELFKEQEQEQD